MHYKKSIVHFRNAAVWKQLCCSVKAALKNKTSDDVTGCAYWYILKFKQSKYFCYVRCLSGTFEEGYITFQALDLIHKS